jgi:hypothetical protein
MAFTLLLAFVLCSMPSAFAQTNTGNIQGTITSSSQANTKLAGVVVTAVAPSGRYTATTDQSGFFSMNGVAPDTYTVSFAAKGYEPFQLTGVTVNQGGIANASTALNQALQRIGRTVSRSTTGAFQPAQTTDQYNVGTTQITTTLGKAGAENEANLLASIPGASFDSSGYPVLRGGREYEEGFQYEGIDYTDAFTHQFVNSLILDGALNFQVSPGAGDASIGNAGTGAINVVAKRGTSPAFGQLEGDIYAGRYGHDLRGEWGWASPTGRYSDYVSALGNRNDYTYGYNGSNVLAIGAYFSRGYDWSNDTLNNFIYKWGKDNNQSLQFFYENTQFDAKYGYGIGPNGLPYKDADNYFLANARADFGLANNQIQAIMPFTLGQTSLTQTIGGGTDGMRSAENYNQPAETLKFQYSVNLNATTFLTAKFYRVDSVSLFDFPYYGTGVFAGDLVAMQGGQRTGFAIDGTKQLGSKNLVGFGGKYDFLQPVYSQPSATLGLLAFAGGGNSIESAQFFTDASCPAAYGGPGPTGPGSGLCGYIGGGFMPASLLPGQTCPAGTTPNTPACPFATQLPYSDESSHTLRQDWAFYLKDTYSPTDRLKIDMGLRLDATNWHYPTCDISSCAPTSFTTSAGGANTYQFNYPQDTREPRIWQPRLAISFQATKDDAFRASYGRSVQFPPIAQVDLTGSSTAYQAYAGIPSLDPLTGKQAMFCGTSSQFISGIANDQPCKNYAQQLFWENQTAILGIPIQPLLPVTYNNYDFSYSHLFPHQVSMKITPFYNKSFNQEASTAQQLVQNGVPLTDPFGNPILGPSTSTNLGKSQVSGVEFLMTKEAAYGLSGSLSLTYQNEFSNVVPTSGSEDFFPSIPPASLALGNLYRVGFLSPFVGALAIQERTHTGWRINPVIYYNHGYPLGAGLLTANYVNGVPFNLPNTNITNSAQLGSAAGAPQYVDPRNPGSLFSPNVDATRGNANTSSAGGELSAARFAPVQLTVEYTSPRSPRSTFGAVIFNAFNQIYSQPVLNSRYQPVATGIAGPYSGYTSGAGVYTGFANYTARRGNEPYLLYPFNIPRTVQFYYQYNL